jgi:hypothetical protein
MIRAHNYKPAKKKREGPQPSSPPAYLAGWHLRFRKSRNRRNCQPGAERTARLCCRSGRDIAGRDSMLAATLVLLKLDSAAMASAEI